MSSINPQNVKTSSIKAVFQAIANAEKTTRSEIAKATGLSLMTAGKIADLLSRAGITREEKEVSGTVGRRASTIRIAESYYGIILDLTTEDYSCEIVGADGKTRDRFSYAYSNDYYQEENLLLFLKNTVLHLNARHVPRQCIGTGIILREIPGTAEASFADIQAIKRIVKETLSTYADRLYLSTFTESAAFYAVRKINGHEQKVILYCRAFDPVQSILIIHDRAVAGRQGPAGDISSLLYHDAMHVSAKEVRQSAADHARKIADAIRKAEKLFDPHAIIIDADVHNPEFCSAIKETLQTTSADGPELLIEASGPQSSHAGMLVRMREHWIDFIISQEI